MDATRPRDDGMTKEQLEAIRERQDYFNVKNLRNNIADVVVSNLYYLLNIDRIHTIKTAAEVTEAIEGAVRAYRNDSIFHAKVETMLAAIYRVLDGDALLDEVDRLRDECESWQTDAAALSEANTQLQLRNEQLRDVLRRMVEMVDIATYQRMNGSISNSCLTVANARAALEQKP
jgi:hypothetical protein